MGARQLTRGDALDKTARSAAAVHQIEQSVVLAEREDPEHLLVRKIAAPLLPPSAVDDAVQETFLMVYRKIHLLQQPQAFIGWISRIALNVCYQWRRKQKDLVPLKPEHSVTTPSSLKVDMRKALEALGKSHRDVLILREYIGLSYEEIAEATNLPEGTVRSRLFYGRKKLEELLGKVYSSG